MRRILSALERSVISNKASFAPRDLRLKNSMRKENRNRHEEHSIQPQLIVGSADVVKPRYPYSGISLVALPEFWHFLRSCHSNFLFELCFQ